MKIIFVNLKDAYTLTDNTVDMLGILSLATIIKQQTDYDVKVMDFQHEFSVNGYKPKEEFTLEIDQQCNYIMKENPNLISFYTMCNNYHASIAIAKKIKEVNPDIKVIFGGPQATLTAEDTIRGVEWIDAIGIGEGEKSIVPIVTAVLNGGDLSRIKGLVYKDENQIINTGMPELIQNLDELPMIDYSLIKMDEMKIVDIDAGRGCPFGCTFCSTKSFWNRRFRLKSPQRIVEEIKIVYKEFHITHFSLTHDLFTANKSKVMLFCELLMKEKLNITWACSSRVDTLDEEVIKMMADAGCKKIFLGVETGSPRMQKIVNKRLKIERVKPIVRLLKRFEFDTVLSFIYGFPEETREDVNMTLKLIADLYKEGLINFKSVQLHELSFFPGTELLEHYSDELVASKDFNATMINDVELPSYLRSIINNNKFIFPHLFIRQSELITQTKFLDRYMIFIYLRTLSKYQFSFELILSYYNNDYLSMFEAYRDIEKETLKNISFYHKDFIRNVIIEAIYSVKRFIEHTHFGKLDFIIKQIAQFEFDITEFLFLSGESFLEKSYPIDVYKAVQEKTVEAIEEAIEVRFNRNNAKSITVNRVKFYLEG